MKATLEHEDLLHTTAELVLDEARKKGAGPVETWVRRNTMTEIYYEAQKISMVRTVFSDDVSLKVLKNQKKGSLEINSFQKAAIQDAVAEALDSADSAAADDAEGVAEAQEAASFAHGPQKPDLESMYKLMDDFFRESRKRYPKVNWDGVTVSHNHTEHVYANSNKVRLAESKGYYDFGGMIIARDGDKSSSFNGFGGAFLEPDLALIEQDGVDRALREVSEQIETGQVQGKFVGEVILPPYMLEEILFYVNALFLSDISLIAGTSIWKDKLGAQVANPMLNWAITPEDKKLANRSALTRDGYVAKDMSVIKDGILQNFVLSRYGAAKTGGKRAGNLASNFVIQAGQEKVKDMISSVKQGIILNRFSGGNPSQNGDMTGVAKNSYLVEDGKIVGPISETMISTNIADLLMRISALSEETESGGSVRLPWAKASGVTVSGK